MSGNRIGKQICYLREKNEITKVQICRGICPDITLYRIELGERNADYMVLSGLYSRLGKSINKLEMLCSKSDYMVCYMQEQIELALDNRNYAEMVLRMQEYQRKVKAERPLHKQYIKVMEGVLCQQKDCNYSKAEKYFLEAIRLTVPDFDIRYLHDYLLSEMEVTIILLWLEQRIMQKKYRTEQDCRRVFSYLKHKELDEEVCVNLYPKLLALLVRVFQQKNQQKAVVKVCEEARALLVKNEVLTGLSYFLEKELEALKRLKMTEQWHQLKLQRDALCWIYEEVGQIYPGTELHIWKNQHQKKVYVFAEMVRKERLNIGATQQMMAEVTGLDEKTLSRVECGTRMPQKYTYTQLIDVLKMNRELCDTKLKVEDFELLEMERDIAREQSLKNYRKARQLFEELKEELSMDEKVNRQYVEYMDLFYQVAETIQREKKIENERLNEIIEKAIEIFEITREWKVESFQQVVLSQLEAKIAIFIARLYRMAAQEKHAIQILEHILKGFDSSMVEEQYHYVEIALILESLACYCETSDELDKALAYAERGICLDLKCERGSFIGEQYMEKTYIQERMGMDIGQCKVHYKRTHQYFIQMKQERCMNALKKYYENKYGEYI